MDGPATCFEDTRDLECMKGSTRSGFTISEIIGGRSGVALNAAVIRRSVVATRGLEMACLTWVSTVRRAILPTLSTA